jgi:neutral ceramidase
MRSVSRRWILLAASSLLASFWLGCEHTKPGTAAQDGELKIGAAEVDITPPVGFRMAGYFDERFSTGVHDPLHAKAIVLRQGSEEIVLAFCDLLGLSLNVTTNARAQASRQTGIAVSNIMICATHAHTGPQFDDTREYYFHQAAVAKYGNDPHETVDYPALLIERLVKVIAAAQADLKPAELSVGIAQQTGLNFNRRYWMKNGTVRFNPGLQNPDTVRPAGPVDHDVGILLARVPGAKEPFAGMTTFAVHSDTVGGTLYSADYEYYLEQTLREAFGEDYISAFGLGTCGDVNHIDVTKKELLKGFSQSARIGRTLGRTVVGASRHLRTINEPLLAVRSATITGALQEVSPEQLAKAQAMVDRMGDPKTDFFAKVAAVKTLDLASRGATVPLEVQVIRLDAETVMVCLPGEIFTELGLAIKHGSPFKKTIVITICNDRPSYVPTERAFSEGSYEVSNARVKPGTGETMVATALDLLRELSPARANQQ